MDNTATGTVTREENGDISLAFRTANGVTKYTAPPNIWASHLCYASQGGESHLRWYTAMTFLKSSGPIDVVQVPSEREGLDGHGDGGPPKVRSAAMSNGDFYAAIRMLEAFAPADPFVTTLQRKLALVQEFFHGRNPQIGREMAEEVDRVERIKVSSPRAAARPQGVSMPRFSTDNSRDALRVQHSHRAPDDEAQKLLREIRQRCLDLAVFLDDQLPPSRERSCALTKLDEARMWACSAAVAGGEIREELTVNIPA